MGNERRARCFKASLEAAGYTVVWKPKKALAPWASTAGLPAVVADAMMVMFRELGGAQSAQTLAPSGWDMQADEVLVEFDEDLHFNRYRNLTLGAPWSSALPWTNRYREYAQRTEALCLRGRKPRRQMGKLILGHDVRRLRRTGIPRVTWSLKMEAACHL